MHEAGYARSKLHVSAFTSYPAHPTVRAHRSGQLRDRQAWQGQHVLPSRSALWQQLHHEQASPCSPGRSSHITCATANVEAPTDKTPGVLKTVDDATWDAKCGLHGWQCLMHITGPAQGVAQQPAPQGTCHAVAVNFPHLVESTCKRPCPCQGLFCLPADGDSVGTLQYGLAALQGPRESMEDYATVVPRGRCGFLYAGKPESDAAGSWLMQPPNLARRCTQAAMLLCKASSGNWCNGVAPLMSNGLGSLAGVR